MKKTKKTKSEKLAELFENEKEIDIDDIDYGDIRKYQAEDFESLKKPSKKVKEVSTLRKLQEEEEEYKGKSVRRDQLDQEEEFEDDSEEIEENPNNLIQDFGDEQSSEEEGEEELVEREDLDILDDEDLDDVRQIQEEMYQSRELLDRDSKEEIQSHLKEMQSKEILGNIQEERRKEKQKAMNVFNQKVLYDNLLKLRILVQKPLLTAARFPQGKTLSDYEENPEIASNVEKVKKSLFETINDLVDLQNELAKSNTEVKCPLIEKNYDKDLNKLWKSIEKQNKGFEKTRNESLEIWNRKTKLGSGSVTTKNFKTINQSLEDQMKVVLKDKKSLISKTQKVRFEEPILGKRKREEEDSEIFDDREFYQVLLRDLIEDVGSSLGSGESLRNAISKNIKKDKRPFKRMKDKLIKYVPHPKLVGFMAPEEQIIPESTDVLFASIFGGKK